MKFKKAFFLFSIPDLLITIWTILSGTFQFFGIWIWLNPPREFPNWAEPFQIFCYVAFTTYFILFFVGIGWIVQGIAQLRKGLEEREMTYLRIIFFSYALAGFLAIPLLSGY